MRPAIIAGIVIIISGPAFAQSNRGSAASKVDLFIGYSYLRTDLSRTDPFRTIFDLDKNLHGVNASISGNVNSWLSIAGDFSIHYSSKFDEFGFIIGPKKTGVRQRLYALLVGPKLRVPNSGRLNPFVHILFGVSHVQARAIGLDSIGAATDKGFSLALGGGLDIALSNRIAIRAVQADYLQTRLFNDEYIVPLLRLSKQDNLRISSGIVFRFGQ